MTNVEYSEFSFVLQLAAVNMLESAYNQLEQRLYKSHEVSLTIIDDFARSAAENNVDLVVAGIWPDELIIDTLEYLNGNGTKIVDFAIDLKNRENLIFPYADHPSAIGNIRYFEALSAFLKELGY